MMREWTGQRRIAVVFQVFKLSGSDMEGWMQKLHVKKTSPGSGLDDARKLLSGSDPESHSGRQCHSLKDTCACKADGKASPAQLSST